MFEFIFIVFPAIAYSKSIGIILPHSTSDLEKKDFFFNDSLQNRVNVSVINP